MRKGGMRFVPRNKSFRADVVFDIDEHWPAEGWTLVVWPGRHFQHEGKQFSFADVEFLVDNAPDFLHSGNRFRLLDGRRTIAHGMVAGPRAFPPRTIKRFEHSLLS